MFSCLNVKMIAMKKFKDMLGEDLVELLPPLLTSLFLIGIVITLIIKYL